LDALPKPLLDSEDSIAASLSTENASARSKLRRIYKLMDQMAIHRQAHVACKQGCAACCRMNITVSAVEAEAIAAAAGRTLIRVSGSIVHPEDEFIGKPCPFLVGEECSIYLSRPLACRKHASYFTSEKWCAPPHVNTVQAPLVRFSGLDEALAFVSARKGGAVWISSLRIHQPEMLT
jgi:uncharacterized protein